MALKPEKWKVRIPHPGIDTFEVYDGDGNLLPGHEQETISRAKLVQAAPDMFNALRHLTDLAERQGWKDYAAEGRHALTLARRGDISR
jgi:hypothetical protein